MASVTRTLIGKCSFNAGRIATVSNVGSVKFYSAGEFLIMLF